MTCRFVNVVWNLGEMSTMAAQRTTAVRCREHNISTHRLTGPATRGGRQLTMCQVGTTNDDNGFLGSTMVLQTQASAKSPKRWPDHFSMQMM